MPRVRITDRHRADQATRLNDATRAHASAGLGTAPAGLTRALAFFRAKYTSRDVQAVFDDLTAQTPGPATLSLIVGIMAAQAAEELRLMRLWKESVIRAEKLAAGGDAAAVEVECNKAEGIADMLKEHRRSTRHLTHSTDAMMRAVKVQSELRLSGAPNSLEVTGTDTARSRLTETVN